MKVFLDTDIGTDADDAVCLAYLLLQPACELLGVSTVGHGSRDRARIADALCSHLGFGDLPIAAGADRPLFPNPYWSHHAINQLPIVSDWPAQRAYDTHEGLTLMRDTIEAHPGEVTLVSIGMLTNVALLSRAYPQTAAKVKELVIMGGRFDGDPEQPKAECNIMLDPVAAGCVFSFPFKKIRVTGSDVTTGVYLRNETIDQAWDTELLAPVLACCRFWLGSGPGIKLYLHDPITAATLFDPAICRFERGTIEVRLYDHDIERGFALEGGAVTGATFARMAADGPHEIAVALQGQHFVQHVLQVLGETR